MKKMNKEVSNIKGLSRTVYNGYQPVGDKSIDWSKLPTSGSNVAQTAKFANCPKAKRGDDNQVGLTRLIYTEPQYHGKRPGGHGYEHYTREVYCTCGKRIGKQTKYEGWDNFSYDDREKAEYKFCPYCGTEIAVL